MKKLIMHASGAICKFNLINKTSEIACKTIDMPMIINEYNPNSIADKQFEELKKYYHDRENVTESTSDFYINQSDSRR